MRYSYGIMDRQKLLLYHPQLFLRGDDVLVLPSKDFQKWHGDLKEYIDSLYQINSINYDKTQTLNGAELKLVGGVLCHIMEELENLFDHLKIPDNPYQYVSTLDKKYKKRKNSYSSDMRRCDMRIAVKPEITPVLKYQNMMEIVDYASWRFSMALKGDKSYKFRK